MSLFGYRTSRRRKILSNRAEDLLLFLFMVGFLGGLLVLQMEFPNGLVDVHVALVQR